MAAHFRLCMHSTPASSTLWETSTLPDSRSLWLHTTGALRRLQQSSVRRSSAAMPSKSTPSCAACFSASSYWMPRAMSSLQQLHACAWRGW